MLRFKRFIPRSTVRLRLAALHVGLLLVSGAGLLTLTYALVRAQSPHSITYHGTAKVHTPASTFTYRGVAVLKPGIYRRHGRSGLLVPLAAKTVTKKGGVQTVPVAVRIPGAAAFQTQRAADLHRLLIESGVAFAFMALTAAAISWLVAGRVLAPMRAITRTARRLSASDLHERLNFDGPRDELHELADTFDGFLSRLETAFVAQGRFIHHASHEFRTPLARQRTLLEVALADPSASAASLRRSCARVLATGEEQERLIDGLLTLATTQEAVSGRQLIDLQHVVGRHVELRRDAVERHGLTISTTLDHAHAYGDKGLVERLVANLLDNAIEHNVRGGSLSVSTLTDSGRATLRVANTGAVLSSDDLTRLTRPFEHRRSSGVQTRAHPGLGLSIVHSVVVAHGADIALRCPESGGLEVAVGFVNDNIDPQQLSAADGPRRRSPWLKRRQMLG